MKRLSTSQHAGGNSLDQQVTIDNLPPLLGNTRQREDLHRGNRFSRLFEHFSLGDESPSQLCPGHVYPNIPARLRGVLALLEGAVRDALQQLGVVGEGADVAQVIASGLAPKWSSLSALRSASIVSISVFLAM